MSSFIAIDSAVPESKILEEVCGHGRHLGHLSRIMFKHIMSKHWFSLVIWLQLANCSIQAADGKREAASNDRAMTSK